MRFGKHRHVIARYLMDFKSIQCEPSPLQARIIQDLCFHALTGSDELHDPDARWLRHVATSGRFISTGKTLRLWHDGAKRTCSQTAAPARCTDQTRSCCKIAQMLASLWQREPGFSI
jgi:hypothetical protein